MDSLSLDCDSKNHVVGDLLYFINFLRSINSVNDVAATCELFYTANAILCAKKRLLAPWVTKESSIFCTSWAKFGQIKSRRHNKCDAHMRQRRLKQHILELEDKQCACWQNSSQTASQSASPAASLIMMLLLLIALHIHTTMFSSLMLGYCQQGYMNNFDYYDTYFAVYCADSIDSLHLSWPERLHVLFKLQTGRATGTFLKVEHILYDSPRLSFHNHLSFIAMMQH